MLWIVLLNTDAAYQGYNLPFYQKTQGNFSLLRIFPAFKNYCISCFLLRNQAKYCENPVSNVPFGQIQLRRCTDSRNLEMKSDLLLY